MIFAATIIGLLVGLVILDETDTENRHSSRVPVRVKSRPESAPRADRDS